MINLFSNIIIPVIIGLIILYGLYKKINVFDVFISGVEENIKIGFKILPALITLMITIGVFRASGLLEFITAIISPVSNFFNIPADIIPQFLLRPLSNSGSLVIFKDILEKHGPDSFIAKLSSVLQGSSETTFYIITIYYGAINIKKTRYTVPCALICDFICFVSSVWISYLFFK
ncbi:MAG: spore maturation protein [Oscillospiraceae bacterium]|nr:spore maturation protein [Oscillospiraceae bacterium]